MGTDQDDPSLAHVTPVFESSPNGLLLVEAEAAGIVALNSILGRFLGLAPDQARGAALFTVPVLRQLATDEESFRAFADEVARRPRDIALRSPHGESLHFNVRGVAYAVQGKPYLLLRFHPLTIDTRSSDSLLKSTWLARLVFENAPDGISVRVASPDFSKKRILACNQRYVEMTGYTEPQLLATENISACVRSLLTPEEDAETERRLRALQPVRGVASWLRPDGRDNAFEWRAVPMRVGGEIYILGIDRDISEQRRTQEDLRARQAERDALISNIPDLVWFKDAQSRYITVNAAFLKAVNRTLDEMRGKTDGDISPAATARKYQADDARVVRSKTGLTVEERHELKGRPPAWIVTSKSPILDKDGNVLGTVGIARDITERRRMEQELKQQRKRLEAILTNVPTEFLAPYADDPVVGAIVTKVVSKRKALGKTGRHPPVRKAQRGRKKAKRRG